MEKLWQKCCRGCGAKVYCEARKSSDLAYIKAYGYEPIDLKELDSYLSDFEIIVNNIPVQILSAERLNLLKEKTLILDLASKPGGTDFEYAKKKGIKTIWALGLPGKVAPDSCAEYIKDTIYDILKKK